MRILFVTTASPWPPRRGYQLRAASLIEQLAPRHQLHLVCADDGVAATHGPPAGVTVERVKVGVGARGLGLLTHGWRRPLQVALHAQAAFARRVASARATFAPDVAVLVLSRAGGALPALDGVPVVVDLVDALALNMRNRARWQPVLAPFWRWEGWRIARWERRMVASTAASTVVSERDRASLLEGAPATGGRLHVVPLGLSTALGAGPGRGTPHTGSPEVLLSGNLGYFPTVDGARWLARTVWPRIHAAVPEARWRLAGARPPASIRALADLPGVVVEPDPPDLAPIRRRATVAVAPMRAGSGTPIKILEAMASGVPVVARPEAAAGLDGLGGEELTVIADPQRFADAIVGLIRDRDAADAQVERARAWLTRHDEGRVAEAFEAVLRGAIAG